MKRSVDASSEPLLPLDDRLGPRGRRHHDGRGMGLTWKHTVYLVIMMMIGAALLDAIINGGLAALMYHDKVSIGARFLGDDEMEGLIFKGSAPLFLSFPLGVQGYIRMWEWPTTLGADIIITVLLTGILTWIIASNLVMRYPGPGRFFLLLLTALVAVMRAHRDMRVGVPLLGKMGSLGIYSPEFRKGKFYNCFLRTEDCIRLPGKGRWCVCRDADDHRRGRGHLCVLSRLMPCHDVRSERSMTRVYDPGRGISSTSSCWC